MQDFFFFLFSERSTEFTIWKFAEIFICETHTIKCINRELVYHTLIDIVELKSRGSLVSKIAHLS